MKSIDSMVFFNHRDKEKRRLILLKKSRSQATENKEIPSDLYNAQPSMGSKYLGIQSLS